MQADTWEGEFNGPASPSTVRENIEVRFLFYSVAGGLGVGQKDKKGRKKNTLFGEKSRNDDYASVSPSNVTLLLDQSR